MEATHSSKKLTSNFNTWCQNSEHYNLNNPHRQWGFRSCEIWYCVAGWVVPTTFMALCSFKMSATTHPTMQCHTQADMNVLKHCVTTSNYMQIVWQNWPHDRASSSIRVTSYMTFTAVELALENTSLQILSIIFQQLPFYHCSLLIYHSCWEVQQPWPGSISSCGLHLSQPGHISSHSREIILHLINHFQQYSSRTYQTSNENHQLNDNWSKECRFYYWRNSMVFRLYT